MANKRELFPGLFMMIFGLVVMFLPAFVPPPPNSFGKEATEWVITLMGGAGMMYGASMIGGNRKKNS